MRNEIRLFRQTPQLSDYHTDQVIGEKRNRNTQPKPTIFLRNGLTNGIRPIQNPTNVSSVPLIVKHSDLDY